MRSKNLILAAIFSIAAHSGFVMADEAQTSSADAPSLFKQYTAKAQAATQAALNQAMDMLGIRYRRGGTSPENGFDCSGFVGHVFREGIGLILPRSAAEISKTGEVSATFDDGTTRSVFQLPIATFQNPDGLTRLSGNAYTISKQSGGMTLNQPGSLGAGGIAAGSLEASTVDLASEFTNMIRFQRAYSASSKIITTVDDMLREVSDLKR